MTAEIALDQLSLVFNASAAEATSSAAARACSPSPDSAAPMGSSATITAGIAWSTGDTLPCDIYMSKRLQGAG